MFELKEKEAQEQMEKLRSERGCKDGSAHPQGTAQDEKPCHFLQVPTHILPLIFGHLSVKKIFLVCVTCKHLHEGAEDVSFWQAR